MPLLREPNAEPVPGYRLIEPLGSGKYGEVWKCEAPGGLFKAVKFVYGNLNDPGADAAGASQELDALQRVKSIRHPFIVSLDRVEVIGGELIIIMELADESLHDRLLACQKEGKPGIPRDELLGYLREAAEALDLMNLRYNLQHLDIKPRNLFLVANHVKVADFGLVNNLAVGELADADLKATQVVGQAPMGTPLYTSPEAFRGELSRFSDQYSLAIVFQELLTGTLPFNGKNFRQLAMQHIRGEPDLTPLTGKDRPILAKALAKDPEHRFPSCMALVQALAGQAVPAPAEYVPVPVLTPALAGGHLEPPPALPQPESRATRETPADLRPDGQTTTETEPVFSPFDCLPGYQFIDCIGRSPLGEVWKVLDTQNRRRLVKFIYGFSAGSAISRELRSAVRLKAMRHPYLAPVEVVQSDPVRLVLLTDPVDQTLRDRFMECQAEGLPGIPRRELLGYLHSAAEALDYLDQQHSVQHLGLNPRNLLLKGGKLLVSDFGLMQLLWVPAGQPVAQLNSRYSAPELYEDNISRACDQYSLALIYQEMLTGHHPHRGQTIRQLVSARLKYKLDLDPLPGPDRQVLSRALSRDPQQRFVTCQEMIEGLEAVSFPELDVPVQEVTASGTPIVSVAAEEEAGPSPVQRLQELLQEARGAVSLGEHGRIRYWINPDGSVEHRCGARVPTGIARHKLEGFREKWNVEIVREEDNHFLYQIVSGFKGFFKRVKQGLEIEIRLHRPRAQSATQCAIVTQVRRLPGTSDEGHDPKQVGPVLLESVFRHLQATSERRRQERFPFEQRVRVRAPGRYGQDQVIEATAKDLSETGIGLYAPVCLPPGSVQVFVGDDALGLSGTVVRAQPCDDGLFEIGIRFDW